ncbi:hypothetical protein EV359DRAFT_65281 [Lentinula novae-zelandiae]|nr:hypothetical protein EV359DRAFT_65281 [Lentinula novae-zelandiae]
MIGYLVERASMGIEYDLRKQQIANYAAFAKLGEHRPSFSPKPVTHGLNLVALLAYDITINMGREVRLVWSTSDRFRWSNVIYFTNRYPVVAYQIWSVCYTPNIPQASVYKHSLTMIALNLINLYARSLQSLVSISFKAFNHPVLTTRYLQKPSGVMTYISLAVFDILATSQCNQAFYISGTGFPLSSTGTHSDIGMSRVVTIPQIIAVVLYFVGVPLAPQVRKKSFFTTFEPRHGSYRSDDFRDYTALSSTTFFSCLREMNESRRESIPDEASLDQATTLSTYDLFNSTNRSSANWMNGSTTTVPVGGRQMNQNGRTQWWAGGTSLVADFDAEIDMR